MIWASGSATAEEANVASIYYWKCIHSTEILQICHSPQSHLITIQTNMCCNCISFSLYLCLYLLLRSSDCSWETKCSKSEYASCPLGLFKSLSSFFHPNIFFDYIFSSMFYICSLLITVGRPNCLICPVPGILSRHLHFFQLYLLNIILWKREIFLLWLLELKTKTWKKQKGRDLQKCFHK